MITPPKPPGEPGRQAELEAFDILDTLPGETYDAITLLASEICPVPADLSPDRLVLESAPKQQ